jgi:response regulator RpfG family c-di-GMP phosphodiesterase
MSKTGPIILVEDDIDDKDIFEFAISELQIGNKLKHFNTCAKAFEYLATTTDQPFIIFCDINLPLMSGIEFKQEIDKNKKLRKKSIPFIFYTTSADQDTVDKAYMELTIQGFFQKPNYMDEIKENIKSILGYWKNCRHPNANN